MTSVEQLIGNLLLRHNCVIIPSFGGFVAKRVSARIDYNNGSMLPPSKSILFNRQLLNNDGLLINEFSRENNVSFDEASQEMDSLVQKWQATLQVGGRIEIEHVGNLFYDEERNICFEQDRFANLLLESFGLGSVHFVSEEDVRIVEHTVAISESIEPVIEQPEVAIASEKSETKEEKITPIIPIAKAAPIAVAAKLENGQNTAEPKRKNRAWRYVAAACILPFVFYSVWIPVKTDVLESGMLSFSDFNPFHQRADGSYEPAKKSTEPIKETAKPISLNEELEDVPSDVSVYSYQFTDDTYIKVALPEKQEADTPTESIDADPIEPETNTNTTFDANTMHFVVGCFGDKVNADNLVAKLRANGLDAAIVDVKGGLHRVTAGGSISEESYQTVKLKAEAIGMSGWRLK
jgi:cell division septation protein DedD